MIFPISFLLVRSITKFKDQALFALGEMIGEILGILSFRDNEPSIQCCDIKFRTEDKMKEIK